MSLTVRLVVVVVMVVVALLVWLWSQRFLRRRLEREAGVPRAGPWPPGRRARDMTRLSKVLLMLVGLVLVAFCVLFVVAPDSPVVLFLPMVVLVLVGLSAFDEGRRVKRL